MRALLTIILCLAASAAQANTLYVHCLRYESKCTGDKCHDIAEKLKLDTKKELLHAHKMEHVNYVIQEDGAKATFSEAAANARLVDGKYTLHFKSVQQNDAAITLENKTDTGAVKEQVIIDKITGFYIKYLLHTDNSIKDVPVGEPYSAYFGWCEDTTDKH
jgi:hypothetical protein